MENDSLTPIPRRFALLIGTSQYNDPSLHTTVSVDDLQTLADVLRDPKMGGFDEVHLLLNETAVEIQVAIAELLDAAKGPDDLLVCYFAGQFVAEQDALYFTVFDTYPYGRSYLNVSAIDLDYVRRRSTLCPSQKQLFVIDGCSPFMDAPSVLKDSLAGNGRSLVGSVGQIDPDEDTLPATQFTRWFIDGLQSGVLDQNGDGAVTLDELIAQIDAQEPSDEVTFLAQPPATDAAAKWQIATNTVRVGKPVFAAVPPTGEDDGEPAAAFNWKKWGVILLLLLVIGAVSLWAVTGSNNQQAAPVPTATQVEQASIQETAVLEPTATNTPDTETGSEAVAPEEEPTVTSTVTIEAEAAEPEATQEEAPTLQPSSTPRPTGTPALTNTPGPTATPIPTSEPLDLTVSTGGAYLREGPAINFRILSILPQDASVTAVARSNDGFWYNVIAADGTEGWLYTGMVNVESADPNVPVAETIPAPENKFYEFVAGEQEDKLVVYVGHTYIGTHGDDAHLEATLLPGPDNAEVTYERGDDLGVGLRIIEFSAQPASDDDIATTTAVRLCMVARDGNQFYCEEFPIFKEW